MIANIELIEILSGIVSNLSTKGITIRLDKISAPAEKEIRFTFGQRRVMIDRLTYDPEVMDAALDYAQNNQIPEKVIIDQVTGYAKEIIPSFSAMAYFGFATKLARIISRLIYRVNLDEKEKEIFSNLDKNATIVFIVNHKSNMDYFILTWLASDRSALSYAVGDWARVSLSLIHISEPTRPY